MTLLYMNSYKLRLLRWLRWYKNLPAVKETLVRSLGWDNPLEKGMTSRSSILAWRITWTEEPGGLQFMGLQGVRHDWATTTIYPILQMSVNISVKSQRVNIFRCLNFQMMWPVITTYQLFLRSSKAVTENT